MTEIKLVQGNDVILKYTVTDQDNAAVNLSGATIDWTLKKSADSTADITKSTTSGISITSAAGGIFQVTLTDEDTEDLDGVYYAESLITDASGNKYTVSNEDTEPDEITFRKNYT